MSQTRTPARALPVEPEAAREDPEDRDERGIGPDPLTLADALAEDLTLACHF
jgi:hypothetical protein